MLSLCSLSGSQRGVLSNWAVFDKSIKTWDKVETQTQWVWQKPNENKRGKNFRWEAGHNNNTNNLKIYRHKAKTDIHDRRVEADKHNHVSLYE